MLFRSGPTAVGKGTVAADIREHHPEIWISVSATTRAPRPGEVHGVHYLFVTEAEFDRVYAINVKSVYLSAIHALPALRKAGGGCFVNIASTAGLRPRPGLTVYNSSKGAVILLSKSMAAEFGPDKVRVNCVNPVFSPDTALSAEFAGGPVDEARRAKFLATIPLGRFSTALDVANAALYLSSDEAAFISGVCIEVDGARW